MAVGCHRRGRRPAAGSDHCLLLYGHQQSECFLSIGRSVAESRGNFAIAAAFLCDCEVLVIITFENGKVFRCICNVLYSAISVVFVVFFCNFLLL